MERVATVILAPGASDEKRRHLVRRVEHRLRRRRLHGDPVLFDPIPADVREAMAASQARILVLAWGHDSIPDWGAACRTYVPEVALETVYLFEVSDFSRQPLHARADQNQEGRFRSTSSGFHVNGAVPYGLERQKALADVPYSKEMRSEPRSLLRPGDASALDIVRLIFEMYVNENKSRREIQNFLNAERAKAPGNRRAWQHSDIVRILTDPAYIGASRIGGLVAFDVRPALVSPTLYFLAQAKLFESCGPGEAPPGHWSRPGLIGWMARRRLASKAPRRREGVHAPLREIGGRP